MKRVLLCGAPLMFVLAASPAASGSGTSSNTIYNAFVKPKPSPSPARTES